MNEIIIARAPMLHFIDVHARGPDSECVKEFVDGSTMKTGQVGEDK